MSFADGSQRVKKLCRGRSFAQISNDLLGSEATFLTIRIVGILTLALIAVLVPAIGENRFWLAGILVFICAPLAVWLQIRYPVYETGWAEPAFDVIAIVTLVQLFPDVWHLALLTGMAVAATGCVAAARVGYGFYSILLGVLITGMSFAAILHNVPNWVPAMLVLLAVCPSTILYVRQESHRVNRLHLQAKGLENLKLLSGGVAHDFNNMLTAIAGNAELVLSDMPEDHPSRASLESVVDGATRAGLLSGQLLAFSGRGLQNKTKIDLTVEVEAISRLMERAIPNGIDIRVETPSKPCPVFSDQAQLQQVLMNIIINAGEAIDQIPATIHVSLARETEQSNHARWAVLKVRDQGVGIAPELIPSLYDPFVTSKTNGFGLGLASAKQIIEESGGRIAIDSKLNQGTTVSIRLPLQETDHIGAETVEAIDTKSDGLALIIEDEAPVREVISRLCTRLGYQVLEAESGYEGVEKYRSKHSEIIAVLLDLRMPGMDGWECLRELRKVGADVPVIIMSGFNPERSQIEEQHVRFLQKPFGLEELRQTLADVAQLPFGTQAL